MERLSERIRLTVLGFCSECNVRLGNTYLNCSAGQFTTSISIHKDLVDQLYKKLNLRYEDMKKCEPTLEPPITPAVAPAVILSVFVIVLVIVLLIVLLGLLFYW